MIHTEVAFLHGAGAVRPAPDPWPITDTKESCRIYYIHEGHATFQPQGAQVVLSPGYFYFFPPNLPFSIENDVSHPLVHTYFDFIMKPPIILDRCIAVDTAEHPALHRLIDAAVELLRQSDAPRYADALLSCINTMLAVFTAIRDDLQYVSDPAILAALDLIHSHYSDGIGTQDIARVLGYQEDYFISKFKAVMKITPYAYIKSIRLHEARRLRTLGMRYEEIAAQVGYADASSLCHAMKKLAATENHGFEQ